MPHALFLGSSLAGIDRLDMMPRPPVQASQSTTSLKLPSFGLRRRSERQTTVAPIEEENIEMKSNDLPIDGHGVQNGGTDNGEGVIAQLDRARSSSGEDANYEAAVKKYEADLKSFDRIRWTDLHIRHATVSLEIAQQWFSCRQVLTIRRIP